MKTHLVDPATRAPFCNVFHPQRHTRDVTIVDCPRCIERYHGRPAPSTSPTLRQLRAERTRAATRALSTMRLCLKGDARPEWNRPDGLPSWWPFWSDCLRDSVRDAVRVARRLAAAEGIEL